MRRNKKNVIGLMLNLTRVLLVPSNEKKLSHRSGSEAALQLKIY